MADTGVIRPHIGGGSHPRGTDAVIAALAERQHGAVARRQLLELGIGRRVIERRIERGQLHLIHLGSMRSATGWCRGTGAGWPRCSPAATAPS